MCIRDRVMTERGSHGNQKVCKVAVDKIVVDVESEENEEDQNIYNTEVKVGHYSDYEVYPTCGLATSPVSYTHLDVYKRQDYDWERIDFWVNEGPAILKHNGKIYLTFSASATGECYCMGMLYIDEDADLLDPACWKKLRRPVLKTDREAGVFGPGHNSFVKAEDGETDLCVYHARPYDEIVGDPLYDPNRHAMVMNCLLYTSKCISKRHSNSEICKEQKSDNKQTKPDKGGLFKIHLKRSEEIFQRISLFGSCLLYTSSE